MTYVKGYKIDGKKVASMIEGVDHEDDSDEYIRVIVRFPAPRTSISLWRRN